MISPARISAGNVISLFFLVGLSSLLSTTVHSQRDNVYNMMVWTSISIIFSHFVYASVTWLSYIRHFILVIFTSKKSKQKKDEAKDKKQSSMWVDFFCRSLDFGKKESTDKCDINLSREEFWYLSYPIAMSVFSIWACIPIFDASCTIFFCLGLTLRSMHVEFYRSRLFHRPLARKCLCFLSGFIGILLCLFIFITAYVTGVLSTNAGFEQSEEYLKEMSKKNLDMIYNATSQKDFNVEEKTYDLENKILDVMDINNPDVVQYINWSIYSYPKKMALPWLTFFTAAFLMNRIPKKLKFSVIVETMHPSISFIAAMTLFFVSVFMGKPSVTLLQSSNSSTTVFVLITPLFVWASLFLIWEYQRYGQLFVPSFVMSIVVVCKLLIQYQPLMYSPFMKGMTAMCSILVILYVLVTVSFIRMENIAIKSGWGDASMYERKDELDSGSDVDMNTDENSSFTIDGEELDDETSRVIATAENHLKKVQMELDKAEVKSV